MRDWYRNASSTAGYAYLDIEHSLNTLPPMAASPCGNQHPFGAIAEAHTHSLLSAYAHSRGSSRWRGWGQELVTP